MTAIKSDPNVYEEAVPKNLSSGSMEARWKRYVEQAKSFVKQTKVLRMEIAKAAVMATEFEGNGYGKNKVFTVERFADEVGVKYKTLLEWVAIYKKVVSKLPPGDYEQNKFEALRRARMRVTNDTPAEKVQVIVNREMTRSMDQEYFIQGLKRLSSLHFFITKKADLKTIPPAEMETLRRFCKDILDRIGEPNALLRHPSKRNGVA